MEKYLVVIDPWADIRRKPIEAKGDYAHDELRETQVLYNEVLLYRDQFEDWYFVEAIEQKKFTQNNVWQGYPGWIRKESSTMADRPVRYDVTVKNSYTFIRKDLSTESEILLAPPIGTRLAVNPCVPLEKVSASSCPRQTRSLRSGGFIRSRSASKLLHAQKTELSRLTTVCSGQPDTFVNDISGIKESTYAGYYQVLLADNKTGWVNRDDVNKCAASPTEEILRGNIVTTAKLFLGAPYLWGGRSVANAKCEMRIANCEEKNSLELRIENLEFNNTKNYQLCSTVNSKLKTQNSKPKTVLPGVDCSGLINLVFRVNNIDIPRDAHDQWMVAEKITHNKLKPGDLIFISDEDKKDRIAHVMLYIGRKRFIEASETGSTVRIRTIREKFGIGLTELSHQAFRIDNKQIYFGRILRT